MRSRLGSRLGSDAVAAVAVAVVHVDVCSTLLSDDVLSSVPVTHSSHAEDVVAIVVIASFASVDGVDEMSGSAVVVSVAVVVELSVPVLLPLSASSELTGVAGSSVLSSHVTLFTLTATAAVTRAVTSQTSVLTLGVVISQVGRPAPLTSEVNMLEVTLVVSVLEECVMSEEEQSPRAVLTSRSRSSSHSLRT